MAGTKEFFDQYGMLTFDEHPFCDGDVIALCQITYMPVYKIVSSSLNVAPKAFSDVFKDIMALYNYKYPNLGLFIAKDVPLRMMQMAYSERYRGVKLVGFKSVYTFRPAVQFGVGTFILPDGTLVVSFEGTDDTLAGWIEDVDLLLKKGTPAYKYAVDYVEELAEKYSGDIILIGHSKGGNEALYTALNCSQKVRDRIRLLYNNDGPGFYSSSLFSTGTYDEIKDRYKHYVPYSSTIGMMLYHDYDYTAVDSTRHLGPIQHDMGTWKITDGNLETVDDIDFLAKVTDVFLAKLIDSTPDTLYEAMGTVITGIWEGSAAETLTDAAKNLIPTVKKAVSTWKDIDYAAKDGFREAFRDSGKLFKESIKAVKGTTAKVIEKVNA